MICLFLSHGQRFAFWTTEAKSLVKGELPPVFRVPRQSGLTTQVPPHLQAVSGRTEAEKALVNFIVHSQGAEQHLMVVFKLFTFSHHYCYNEKGTLPTTYNNPFLRIILRNSIAHTTELTSSFLALGYYACI